MADRSEYWKKRWAKQKEEGTIPDRHEYWKKRWRRNLNPPPNPNQSQRNRSPRRTDTVKDITTTTTRNILRDLNVDTPKDMSTETYQKDPKRKCLTIPTVASKSWKTVTTSIEWDGRETSTPLQMLFLSRNRNGTMTTGTKVLGMTKQ